MKAELTTGEVVALPSSQQLIAAAKKRLPKSLDS